MILRQQLVLNLFAGTAANAVSLIGLILGALAFLWIVVSVVRWVRRKLLKGEARMKEAAAELRRIVANASGRMLSLPADAVVRRSGEGSWSKKEIVGHLIDSAANNHQRFVRAQLSGEIRLPEYEPDAWVRTQSYESESWEELVSLWKSYNLHLAHVIAAIPEPALKSHCFIGSQKPVTLEFLIEDYLGHIRHHLDQVFS